MQKPHIDRRGLLKAAGVTFGLPLLESIAPRTTSASENAAVPRRMVCICNGLGLHLPNFVPDQSGRDYEASRYLKEIDHLRDHYTVISGVTHPDVDGGHAAESSFLTTAPHPGSTSFKNSISLDQQAADHIGRETRFPSLALATTGPRSLSWTRAGVPIPAERRPSQLFAKLFLAGSGADVEQQVLKLRMGESIMDTVRDQAKSLERKLNPRDRHKLDEYMTSVREVEEQMRRSQEWERKPKPRVDAKPPKDIAGQADTTGLAKLMFDLTHLALQTDSTRIITIMMQGFFIVPPIAGVEEGYHTVSHHGRNKRKLEQLALIETEHMKVLGGLLEKLHNTTEDGDTLLDRTMVLYGSNMGNASSHDNRNLPTILAGGGFKHGQHLGFDATNNYPLANLYVSMLQRLSIETDRFGSGTGTMRGLELS